MDKARTPHLLESRCATPKFKRWIQPHSADQLQEIARIRRSLMLKAPHEA